MPKTLQLRRYDTTALSSITAAEGELIVDTTQDTISVGDGSTVGGTYLVTQTQLNANVSALNINIAGANSLFSTANTRQNLWTSTQIFTGNVSAEAAQIKNIVELSKINTTAISANTTIDLANGSVQYWTTNAGSNTTLNIIYSEQTTLNTVLDVGDSISSALLFTNGATAYYPNNYQIDGVAITPKWQGNTTPTGGNANSIDVYGFTIIKTAAGNPPTYTVLASQTQYK